MINWRFQLPLLMMIPFWDLWGSADPHLFSCIVFGLFYTHLYDVYIVSTYQHAWGLRQCIAVGRVPTLSAVPSRVGNASYGLAPYATLICANTSVTPDTALCETHCQLPLAG